MGGAKLALGDAVFVFYRMSKRCHSVRQYVAALDPRQGTYRPRMGLSEGFVPGRVAAEPEEGAKEILVEYTWPYYFTERGHAFASSEEYPWTELHWLTDVKPASDFAPAQPGPRMVLSPPGWQPELAILSFRWGGLNRIVVHQQWGDTGSSVSDLFVDSFLDMAVVPRLGNTYEVWTVYIEDASDLAKLAESAHLIFGPSHPLRRARHVCGMYFLYPTAFEENCVPTMETGEDKGAAMVDQKSLFRLMKAVERAGIPTRFPHASGLYEQLASKRWTFSLVLAPQFRVPATVALPRMLVEQNCSLASEKGLTALRTVKAQQARLRGVPESEADNFEISKGVAKLGFSWEALDVKFWQGPSGFEDALVSLTQMIEISGEMTGQPHDCESIIVQEYVPHDLELRAYVVEGTVEAIIYTKFCRIKENNEFGDFQELFSAEEAAQSWMGGDAEALADGERQCREVTNHWLVWVQAQACEVPPAIRFDYFVGRAGQGKASVWTLEICELGFSMLGEKDLPAKVFAAMMRSCLCEGVAAAAAPSATSPEPQVELEGVATAAPAVATPATAAGGYPPDAGAARASSKHKGAPHAKPQRSSGDKSGKGFAKGGNFANVAQACSEPPPTVLRLAVPNGIPDQKKCAGVYALEAGVLANGRPLWKHSRGDRWIYNGTDDHWYIGDTDEFEADFDCCEGYLRHPCAADGKLPHQGPSAWERFNTKAGIWAKDPGVVASAVEASSQASSQEQAAPNGP